MCCSPKLPFAAVRGRPGAGLFKFSLQHLPRVERLAPEFAGQRWESSRPVGSVVALQRGGRLMLLFCHVLRGREELLAAALL